MGDADRVNEYSPGKEREGEEKNTMAAVTHGVTCDGDTDLKRRDVGVGHVAVHILDLR